MPENLVEEVLASYCQVYEKIYKKPAGDVRALRGDWVVVNGVKMHAHELAVLTRRLIDENQLTIEDCSPSPGRRHRLLRWLQRQF